MARLRQLGAVGATWMLTALAFLPSGAGAQATTPLSVDELDSLRVYLHHALAGADEPAYLQVLTEARVVQDATDTNLVYDLVVRYDPGRYHAPHAGLYPLTFEDQFIQWGKRIALFTRSVAWSSSRFYLHDISTGEQGWIYSDEARRLYPTGPRTYPGTVTGDDRAGQRGWLKLMHTTDPGTELRAMSLWLYLLRREAREAVVLRAAGSGP